MQASKANKRITSKLLTALLAVALVFTMMPLTGEWAYGATGDGSFVVKGNVMQKEMTLSAKDLTQVTKTGVSFFGANNKDNDSVHMIDGVVFADLLNFVGMKKGATIDRIDITTVTESKGTQVMTFKAGYTEITMPEDSNHYTFPLNWLTDPSKDKSNNGLKGMLALKGEDTTKHEVLTVLPRLYFGGFEPMAKSTKFPGDYKNRPYWYEGVTSIEVVGTVPPVVDGQEATVDGNSYAVTSASAKTAAFTKGKNGKKQSVPSTVTVNGVQLRVTEVAPNAFTGTTARTVTLGQNIEKLDAKAFAKSKVTKLVVKTKKLTKASVKGSLKSSKVKKIQVKVGSKKVNKKYVKKYKKFFTKKNAGKKARVYR